jgi:hypothetical protein
MCKAALRGMGFPLFIELTRCPKYQAANVQTLNLVDMIASALKLEPPCDVELDCSHRFGA